MKVLKYFSEGKFYNDNETSKDNAQGNFHAKIHEKKPKPLRNSYRIQTLVNDNRNLTSDQFRTLLPVNTTTEVMLEKHNYNQDAQNISKIHQFKPKVIGNESRLLKNSLYLAKNDFQINPDVLHKTDIRNAQALSRETPEWAQRPMKHYTPEFFNPSMKAERLKEDKNLDVFGNQLQKRIRKTKSEQNMYNVPGQITLKQDSTRQFWMDKDYHNGKISKPKVIYKPEEMQRERSLIKMNWPENLKKQSYDTPIVAKIGSGEYHSRLLNGKRQEAKVLENIKLYESNPSNLKKQKPIEIKLGASTWNPDNIIMLD